MSYPPTPTLQRKKISVVLITVIVVVSQDGVGAVTEIIVLSLPERLVPLVLMWQTQKGPWPLQQQVFLYIHAALGRVCDPYCSSIFMEVTMMMGVTPIRREGISSNNI